MGEEEENVCKEFRKNLIGRAFHEAIPFLYPFVVEYALIGASVALIMAYHIRADAAVCVDNDEGSRKKKTIRYRSQEENPALHDGNRISKPNPYHFVKNLSCANSKTGLLCGLLILLVAIVNLAIFYGLTQHSHTKDEAELVSKLSNTIINSVGIIACLLGLKVIRRLKHRDTHHLHSHNEMYNLDDTLLRFGAIFVLIYNIFTIITGSFMKEGSNFPFEIHILNGIVEIVQVILQIIFIHNLMDKCLQKETEDKMPGRQICMFMFVFNISQWLVFTFEIQKLGTSLLEAQFYGFMPWVIIRRVTLPLVVFFRFHSAVVSIEMWKRRYNTKQA